MLAFWLGAMILLPTLPLAVFSWHGYRSEIRQFENQLQDTNRQIATLAGSLLLSILQEAARQLEEVRSGAANLPDAPLAGSPIVSFGGEVLATAVDPGRLDDTFPDGLPWVSIESRQGRPFNVSGVVSVPALGGRRVFVRVCRPSPDGSCRIASLEPNYLHEQLTSRFDSLINRHIYAIDDRGAPIFYSAPELVDHPEMFHENEPVRRYIAGRTGPVQYVSVISGRPRLGYVSRMEKTGWAIVVSADVAESMIDIRKRFLLLILAVLVAGVLAISTFFLFSTRLVFPLSELAREIRRKDRDLRSPVRPPASIHRIRELAELVEDLNIYIDHFIKAERKTIQAEKLATLGELTTGLAHELGTPLNVVRGSAQLVKRKVPDDAASQAALDRIVVQTERITELIRNLLDIARLEKVRPERIDLRRLIGRVRETVSVMYPDVTYRILCSEPDVPVFVQRRAMEHAFLNLYTNACQAMEGRGDLCVSIEKRTEENGAFWVLEIEDSGPGIDPQHIEHVFRPFYSTKSAGKGSGLGLALVERVIRENDGGIVVESEPGRGAVFRVTLPVSAGNNPLESWRK